MKGSFDKNLGLVERARETHRQTDMHRENNNEFVYTCMYILYDL